MEDNLRTENEITQEELSLRVSLSEYVHCTEWYRFFPELIPGLLSVFQHITRLGRARFENLSGNTEDPGRVFLGILFIPVYGEIDIRALQTSVMEELIEFGSTVNLPHEMLVQFTTLVQGNEIVLMISID